MRQETSTERKTSARCSHCGTVTDAGERFCCVGCASVYDLLQGGGLGRYYDLREGTSAPVAEPQPSRELNWLSAHEARLAEASGPTRVVLDVQGMHCAGCVWLLEELFQRRDGAMRAVVNPAIGQIELLIVPVFSLAEYVHEVERFGYKLGPSLKADRSASNGLLARIGVCAALALNAMIFAIPLYLGMPEGPTHVLFSRVAFAITTLSVLVGGSVFFRSAWTAAKRGVLHLDLPIAIGVALAFAGSAWAFAAGRDGSGSYFDTISIFITLMLVGRWLQERVVEKNRRYLLASDGADGLLARRIDDGTVALVRCTELRAKDALLIAPGDVVPVAGALREESASCSLDWINGESAPRSFRRGETVPAGAFNVGMSAVTLDAESDFAASPLVSLLRASGARGDESARSTAWWQRLAKRYVIGVLVAASAGFFLWIYLTGSVARALEVSTAILVVTCPCAFGLATPMAYELVLAGLRRAGLFVRSSSFLDRALDVRQIVFDKTGTLTTGVFRLANPEALDALTETERSALGNLVVRSTHPKSVAVARALRGRYDGAAKVTELPGFGLELFVGDSRYRLGSSRWAAPNAEPSDALTFSRDGRVLARLQTEESLRADARREITELTRDGYAVFVLSGDDDGRVAEAARALHIERDHALGGQSPSDKARWLSEHDRRDTLMIGDGINDALAVERAHCSATMAIDRPFMPARTDFYVVSAGLRPIGLALRAARELSRINRRNLRVALAYNALAVALCLSGLMSPLLCAVFMPSSSLSILLATIASLSSRSALWTSSSCKSS